MAKGKICIAPLEAEGRCWLSGLTYRLGKKWPNSLHNLCQYWLIGHSGRFWRDQLNVNNNAYAPVIDDDDEEVKEACVGDSKGKEKQASLGDKEGVAKQASVTRSLEFSYDKAYIDTIEVDSDDKFWSFFPRDPNSRNYILGGPQKPDTMGMTATEKEITIKLYRKARKSFTNKEPLALMKSMSNKGVAALPQKSQLGNFKGDPNKMV
jgi:hypothetical protein